MEPPSRVAIVTGGGHNVGRAIAEAFAGEGMAVVVASRNGARLDETVRRIRQAGGEALAVPTDCTVPAQVDALIATTLARYGTVDVLAAIAGGGSVPKPLDAIEPDEWERCFRTNVTSAFLCLRAVLPTFRRRNSGAVLLCAGGGAFHPVLGEPIAAYACAKAALCRLTDQATAELLDTGIRVNCIDPGLAWDDETLAAVEREERRSGRPHPQRTAYRPASQAAELAAWLVAERSDGVRGRCVSVYDAWWRDPAEVAAVERTLHRYRLRRYDG